MMFASRVLFLLGLVAAVAALPAQAGASPAAGGWPTVVHVKRTFNTAFRCTWDQDARGLVCVPRNGCILGPIVMNWSPRRDRIVRLDMSVDVHYGPRNRRAERRNIACAMKTLDLFFPAWQGRRAWFEAAVSKALRTEATSTRRVGGKTIAVEYQSPSDLPDIYVGVTIR